MCYTTQDMCANTISLMSMGGRAGGSSVCTLGVSGNLLNYIYCLSIITFKHLLQPPQKSHTKF